MSRLSAMGPIGRQQFFIAAKCILCITDEDLKLMVDVYETKQRDPMEIINKKYVEFIRSCPS